MISDYDFGVQSNVIVVFVFDNVIPKCDCIAISVTVSVNIMNLSVFNEIILIIIIHYQ